MNTLSTFLEVKDIIDGKLDSFDIKYLSTKFDKRYNNLRFKLNYPLSVEFNGFIESADSWMDIIYAICSAYKAIYNNAEHYGIWGHDIGDLAIEIIEIKGNNIEVFIGS